MCECAVHDVAHKLATLRSFDNITTHTKSTFVTIMASTATSTATQTTGTNGLPCVKVSHSSGANATVYLFGATLTSWQTAAGVQMPVKTQQTKHPPTTCLLLLPSGNEVLFLSSKAQFDGTTPIRGGIPLVFPQFGGGKANRESPSPLALQGSQTRRGREPLQESCRHMALPGAVCGSWMRLAMAPPHSH